MQLKLMFQPWSTLVTLWAFVNVILATNIEIDVSRPTAFSSSRFVSYNFDWHPNNEEPPLWINASIQKLNLSSIALQTAVQALPTRLRIGGSEEDDECKAADVDAAFCLNMDRWEEIVSFTTKNNIDLVFGLNAMRRANNTDPENFDNIKSFLNYTYLHNLKVFGFEFGNELVSSKVDPITDGHDYVRLHNIIQSIWNSSGNVTDTELTPKLIGNDMNPNPDYLQKLLPIVKDVLDVMTYHNYDGYGLDMNLTNEIVTPQFLDKTYENIKGVYQQYIKNLDTEKTEIWIGETAAAWHSGQENCTNSFVSSFWYSDALGRLSAMNHTGFCRQTLIGGAYGLLTRDEYKPNPDYYTGKLWHNLAGDNILNLSDVSEDMNGYLRVYAFCSRRSKGNVGVLLINISPTENISAVIDVNDAGNSVLFMDVYALTADSLKSRFMKLNGKLLVMDDETTLPCLTNCPLKREGNIVELVPYSITFVDAKLQKELSFCT